MCPEPKPKRQKLNKASDYLPAGDEDTQATHESGSVIEITKGLSPLPLNRPVDLVANQPFQAEGWDERFKDVDLIPRQLFRSKSNRPRVGRRRPITLPTPLKEGSVKPAPLPSWFPPNFVPVLSVPNPNIGGFVFLRSGRIEQFKADDVSAANFPPTFDSYMTLGDLQFIDAAAKDALLQCNVVLANMDDPMFEKFFKNRTHEVSIRIIFTHAQSFLQRLINREHAPADNTVRLVGFIRLMMLKELFWADAAVTPEYNRFVLFPRFFKEEDLAWGELYKHRGNSPNLSADIRSAAARLINTTTLGNLLLHEVCHFVSFTEGSLLHTSIAVEMTKTFIAKHKMKYIEDMTARQFAHADDPRDQHILNLWEKSKYYRKATDGKVVAYGYMRTRFLTELKDGATASFLNADSYALFAATLTSKFLHEKWCEMEGFSNPSIFHELVPMEEARVAELVIQRLHVSHPEARAGRSHARRLSGLSPSELRVGPSQKRRNSE